MEVNYDLSCRLDYSAKAPSVFIFNVAPSSTVCQHVRSEHLSVTPTTSIEEFSDPYLGNRYHRIVLPEGSLSLRYQAVVATDPVIGASEGIEATPPARLPSHTLPYILPSRHCESDLLMRLAWREFGDVPATLERPASIAEWIYENVDYLVGETGSMTSAFNTATARAGVCRDFAHLGIAFCRALNIPARFVSAYAYDLWPPDFHAVFEAWLDGRWYLFDATRKASRDGLVRLGTGRDAADVSFALIFGPAVLTHMDVKVEGRDRGNRNLPRSWAEYAVSSA